MTSCPAEEDLVLFVEGELGEARTEEVADHLVACEECRRLVGRSEAALRYALGGLADLEAAPVARPDARPIAAPRRGGRLVRLGAAAAAVAAAVGIAAFVALRDGADEPTTVARLGTHEERRPPARPATLAEEIAALSARAERIAASPAALAPAEEDADVALAALAAAEARLDLGIDTGPARLRDVVERFPSTGAAREARARLAALEDGR